MYSCHTSQVKGPFFRGNAEKGAHVGPVLIHLSHVGTVDIRAKQDKERGRLLHSCREDCLLRPLVHQEVPFLRGLRL